MAEYSDHSAPLTSPSQLLQRAGRRLFMQSLAVYAILGPDMGLAFARSLGGLGLVCEREQSHWALDGMSCVCEGERLRWMDISHRKPLVANPSELQVCLRTQRMDEQERSLREVILLTVGNAPPKTEWSETYETLSRSDFEHRFHQHYRKYSKVSGMVPIMLLHTQYLIQDLLVQGYRLRMVRSETGSPDQECLYGVLERKGRWVTICARFQRAIAFTKFAYEQRESVSQDGTPTMA